MDVSLRARRWPTCPQGEHHSVLGDTARQQAPSSGAAPPLFLAARLMSEDKAQHGPAGDSRPDEGGETRPKENAVAGIT